MSMSADVDDYGFKMAATKTGTGKLEIIDTQRSCSTSRLGYRQRKCKPVYTSKIKGAIKGLNNEKATGVDNLCTELLNTGSRGDDGKSGL